MIDITRITVIKINHGIIHIIIETILPTTKTEDINTILSIFLRVDFTILEDLLNGDFKETFLHDRKKTFKFMNIR
ncbi:hypothetical protein LEP1GSC036_3486 [Leptospira weilii str. 2006001853]|uniref:Uncharacterized protein n=3 Tax=Leptospira weilii TaxID=28184 RepID=A0A828Z7V7_9LEPT|nr:hypothetical protein LEP1GSC036_3486 [Leptospira weilii str. 2006001853]EMJ66399.1 hypothetical protein LEP1GSC051_2167 [Leptospira sp. P2653]EMM73175.1 hypothetical protein LEP1GSC038_1416 [Leptospira weilii str. 2006001855]EMN45435.1 hypothetical protein LEP1GSC086_3791 [Leptospira weilii str. LNT 1234]EMY12130.1 hypothetical protein LEP1GSC043_3105 [Leptospira weilii str. Ecochallenge]QDK23339.1 hypothetical protein FHG67_11880 [Leptospira weilii]